VIVFCLATGEWSIRRLDGAELSNGNDGPNELWHAISDAADKPYEAGSVVCPASR
jgi:hypothetical protein